MTPAAPPEPTPTDYVDPLTGEVIGDDEWEDIEPQQFKFANPGDSIAGVYRGMEIVSIKGEETSKHSVNATSGPAFFFGSTTLDGALVPIDVGDTIRVTFTGLSAQVYKGGNKAKLFKVQRRKQAQPF